MTIKRLAHLKVFALLSFCMLTSVVLLAACGSGATTSATTSSQARQRSVADTNSSGGSSQNNPTTASSTSKSTNNASQDQGPAYLIKTLNVTMQVANPRQVSTSIGNWINATDPRSTSAGAEVSQDADGKSYDVTLTYDVQATLYPQIYNYLRDYNLQKGTNSHLVSFKENVQDVSNDYVDTQSRIKNYKGEQARLLTFLNQANKVEDVLSIETQLTTVEGNIETSEAHLNLLASQVTYYTVTISLQPLPVVAAPSVTTAPGWSFGQVISSAFSASLDFARSLLTYLIWVLAFAIYIIPVLIIVFLIRRYSPYILLLFDNMRPVQTPPKTK